MASTSISLPTAPNFSGDNYDFWATKMQRFLIASDLWDIVDKGFEALVANAQLTEEQQKISNENSSKDAKALFILQFAVSDKIFPSIKNATTAKQAWAILQQENQDTNTDWMESMRVMQYHSGEKSNISSMSIVPKELRKGNEKFYEPKFVSIGPRFRGTSKDLLKEEKTKWECMSSLLDRAQGNAESNLANCGKLISESEKEKEVCEIVDGLKQMKWRDITNIMLYDACFLLEILISESGERNQFYRYSLLWEEPEKVLSDLLVLDNQIPLSILRKLYCQLFPDRDDSIETLALNLFDYDLPPDEGRTFFEDTSNASHFVDLVHSYISMDLEDHHILQTKENKKPAQLDRCATRLRAAGVKINPLHSYIGGRAALNFRIRFDSSSGTLDISPLVIMETTEARWRNLIAWEHDKEGRSRTVRCICTSAALFFNALICCDVQLLKDSGIIVDFLHESNKDLVTYFRSIRDGVDRDSHYYDFAALNKYYRSTIHYGTQIPTRLWHHLTGSPREALRDLHNSLKRGYNYAAALITVLSLLQTIYAVLSYHHPKKEK